MKKILLILNPKYAEEPGGQGDKAYARRLEAYLNKVGAKASVFWGKLETTGQADILCQRYGLDAVATTREDIVKLYEGKQAKHGQYTGSLLHTPAGRELLILPQLKYYSRVAYGEWYIERLLSKIIQPEKWPVASPFTYKILEHTPDYIEFKARFKEAWLASIDIETVQPNVIRTISYTLKFHDDTTETRCFKMDSMEKVRWMRELNDTPVTKVTQNGKYECAHFAAWGAPMRNWSADTLNAMHSTWAELPKDLNFVSSIFNREHTYWKDLGSEGGWENLLHYNALDTWQTCEAFCAWLKEAPEYSLKNYVLKFPQNYLSHEMEMLGLKRDPVRKARWNRVQAGKVDATQRSLETMTAVPDFNVNSYPQVRALMKALTGKEHKGSDEKYIRRVMLTHPLRERVLGAILELRSESKILSTYLGVGDKDKDFLGRWLYSINPHGTDTGRDASGEHHFWCGQNVQNVPNGRWEIKNTVVADPGYIIYEADFSQAEARGVAYCSGDEALLAAVNSPRDFHSLNASAFFGVPYEKIYCDQTKRTLDRPLRDLAKRVNHGANYNMGAGVLLETMGERKVREAQVLLNLPKNYTLPQVCEHLLNVYEVKYPRVKGAYYNRIKRDVKLHSKLVGSTGWTRWCFGDPSSNKLALNSLVAHVTQSLNALILDEAARRVFIWRQQNNLQRVIRVHAKIHDSLLFQVRETHEHLAKEIPKIMSFPVVVEDCTGKKREMLVPAELERCGKRWEMYQ